jgi:CRP/FNR family transcriptional regulator, cyclic AMP receptor protein
MELDFTGPARGENAGKSSVALNCFRNLGSTVEIAAGRTFFIECQASDRMYMLLEGEVALSRDGKSLDIVRAEEIFGEMAAITGQPRTATATARSACKALALDARQFQQAVQANPEFALALMGIMNNRLRLTVAMMGRNRSIAEAGARESARVFDKKMLDDLAAAMRVRPSQTYPAGRPVMKEGEPGLSMYIVMRGKVAVTIKGVVVERVGAGGVFGEMALVDQSPRAASAAAEEESLLLAISRNDFLTLVKTRPDFAVSLLKAVAERLRHMTAQKK